MNAFIYSIINTHPAQLYFRLKYLLRRKLRTGMSARYRIKLNNNGKTVFQVNNKFKQEILIRKSGAFSKTGKHYSFNFLNEPKVFSIPFDWHREELNTGTRLWKLNLHYMEYLSETSNSDFKEIVTDWIDSNPPYMKNYALDNWNSYALSIRTVVWMYEYSRRRENLDINFSEKLLNSLYIQIQFLYENPELDIGGNHIIKNIKALLWANDFFISEHSNQWLRKGEKLLDRELDLQILKDGMHYELSPSYHSQVFIDLLECYNVVHNQELKNKLYGILSKMIQVISDLSMSDGYIAQFSDGGYHMASSPSDCIQAWKYMVGEEVVQNTFVSQPFGGYYGIHRDDIDLIVDCGKLGADNLPAHGHGDIFSFELCAEKKRLIIDTGVYEYNPGEKRSYSRSSRAHNTVTLNDQDQGEFYSSFRLGRRAAVKLKTFSRKEDGFELTAVHDGYKRLKNNPEHERSFLLFGNNIVVKDIIQGGAFQSVKSRLLLHPDCRVSAGKNQILIAYHSFEMRIETDHRYSVVEASWFPDFGIEIPTRQIVFDYGFAPCSGEYIIYIPEIKSSDSVNINSLQNNFI